MGSKCLEVFKVYFSAKEGFYCTLDIQQWVFIGLHIAYTKAATEIGLAFLLFDMRKVYGLSL